MIGSSAGRLILFDIDGTLLQCGPQVRPIFRDAMRASYGETGRLDGHDFAGKTDDQIVIELLTGAGFELQRVRRGLPRMRREYAGRLERSLDPGRMLLLPGVRDLLAALAACDRTTLGLLTGNWERGARIKLSRFGLNRYFSFGAFGDGQEDRRQLPPIALERAAGRFGRPVWPGEAVIVGDTALDVACARAHGIRCLAVATGGTPVETLTAAGADWVCKNLLSENPLTVVPTPG